MDMTSSPKDDAKNESGRPLTGAQVDEQHQEQEHTNDQEQQRPAHPLPRTLLKMVLARV